MWKWLTELFGSKAQDPAADFLSSARTPQAPANRGGDADRLRMLLARHYVKLHQVHFEPLLGHLREGRKIEAIKLIRTKGKPGLGLKEAKDLVDAF